MAGASLLRKLVGEVAEEAPQLTSRSRRAVVNIGLDIPGGGRLTPEEALAAVQRVGVKPLRVTVAQSDTEPTLVVELDRSLAPHEADEVSRTLQQEAIAQVDETGAGELFGPSADKWRPFNGDYFITGDGKRLTQQIMEAGDPDNVPGGVEADPVMAKLDEIAASLKTEEPAYNKGGLVKKGVEALTDAIFSGATPKNTTKAYKLFRQKDGKLYPLFVDANEEVPVGQWLKAKPGEQASSGKVKSKLGELAYRPGWHAGDLPIATHIGARSHKNPKLPPDTRPSDQVWADIDMAADIDWQKVANERAKITKKGKPDPKTAHITDQVPYGGHYRYKTNPNMTGEWIIGGDMRVNRVLTDEEVQAINEAAGVADLPRREGYNKGGLVKEGAKALMRLYHGRSYKEPIQRLDPTISPDQLGIHLGDAETAGKFATIRPEVRVKDAGARVIPLDVELQNPLRLSDKHGKWRPDDVYKQLADGGVVPWDDEKFKSLKYRSDGMVQDVDGSWIDAGDGAAELDAMLEVQDMIRELGYDGVVYTNRFELPDAARERARSRDPIELRSMSDEQFKAEFPEAVDSYIVFRNEQLKSPFGEGPGVGFADGGRVALEGGGSPRGKAGAVYQLGKGLVDLLDFSGVTGKPKTVKIPERGEFAAAPIKELDEAAEAYMQKYGIPGTHRIDGYPEFDEDFAKRIADEYDRAKHTPNDPAVRRAYDALLDETMAQYRALEGSGLDVRFLKEGMGDPYAKSPSMGYADIVDNGRLWVFPTEQGYGSDVAADISNHPLLKRVGRVGDKENAVANDAFRVVHDVYGHFGPGNPFFRRQGEDRAWQHHARMFTDDALPAMSAETRGQNSWVNSGPHAAQNRGLSGGDTIYADQKATIMPSWVYERDLGRKPRGYADGGPVWSEEDIASMTHDKSFGTGREMNYLETLGTQIPIGEMNYFDVDGERQMPGGVQGLHDVGRIGAYLVPGLAIPSAALDTYEGVVTGDPTNIAMAAAGLVPASAYIKAGKALWDKVKPYAKPAAASGALAYALEGDEAEAGMFGTLAKWAKSSEGSDALQYAKKLYVDGHEPEKIRHATGWKIDLDGEWKFELPSAGGSAQMSNKGRLPDWYDDPHLFDQYPHMKDIEVTRRNREGASYDPLNRRIYVGDLSSPFFSRPDIGGLKGVLDHEIYHSKAGFEGWAQGSNTDMARQQIADDIKRFLSMKGDPYVQNVGKNLQNWTPKQRDSLAFSRYEADIGEALASREAKRRDYAPSKLYQVDPSKDIAMPQEAVFYKNAPATIDQYIALVDWHNSKVGK